MSVRLSHPGQPNMFVQEVLSSRSTQSWRTVNTLHLRYPRIIHGEMMTARVFNRNARSSRAVPIETLLKEIRNDPFIPWHWTGHKKGMQGVPGHDALVYMPTPAADCDDTWTEMSNVEGWLWARDRAVEAAEAFGKAGYHKQVANRLVEPFMWMDLLVTSTHWANFLHLRDHEAAEPHIRDLAVLVGKVLDQAQPTDLDVGEWHLPYITAEDHAEAAKRFVLQKDATDFLKKVSAARCARISYKPFDGNGSYERELERYDGLVNADAVHASPLEHQCSPDRMLLRETSLYDDEDRVIREVSAMGFEFPELHASLTGWIQARKLVPNEAVHD